MLTHSNFLKNTGKYHEAIQSACSLVTNCSEPDQLKQIYYFKAQIYRFLNQHSTSRSIIDKKLTPEKNFQYLRAIRHSANNQTSLIWFEKKMSEYVDKFDDKEDYYFNKSLLFHSLSIKDRAVDLAQKRLDLIIEKGKKFDVQNKLSSWSSLAQKALLDVKISLDTFQIPFFLISGTLLGVIREGKLLEHDYDIDIGIDEGISHKEIITAFAFTGLFTPLENNFQNYFFSFSHTNGVKIDIFIHYKINNKYRHRTSYVAWDNTCFGLKPHIFLNKEFLIPEDPDKYLEENYNNWRSSPTSYNTLLDTPNLVKLSIDDYIFQLAILMADSFQKNNKLTFTRAAKKYKEITGNGKYLITF